MEKQSKSKTTREDILNGFLSYILKNNITISTYELHHYFFTSQGNLFSFNTSDKVPYDVFCTHFASSEAPKKAEEFLQEIKNTLWSFKKYNIPKDNIEQFFVLLRKQIPQNLNFTNVSLLNKENYVINQSQEIYFYTHDNQIVPFNLKNVNYELRHYNFQNISEKIFIKLKGLLIKNTASIKQSYSSTLAVIIFKFLKEVYDIEHAQINSVDLCINPFTIYLNKLKKIFIYVINNNYISLINFLERNFIFNLENGTTVSEGSFFSNFYDFLYSLNSDYMQCIPEETFFRAVDYIKLYDLHLTNYTMEIKSLIENTRKLRKTELYKELKINSFPDIKVISEFFNKSLFNNSVTLRCLSMLFADIYNVTNKSQKLHVIICEEKTQKLLNEFFNCVFPNTKTRTRYEFDKFPFRLNHNSSAISKVNIINNPIVSRFSSKELYKYFNGKCFEYQNQIYQNTTHYIVFTTSITYSKRLKEYYNADVMSISDFYFTKECLSKSPNEIRNTLVLLGKNISVPHLSPEYTVEEFLIKFTKKDKKSYVLSSLLIDSIKKYVTDNYGSIKIKDYSKLICKYIGNENALVRRTFSEAELDDLPEKYRNQIQNAKRPISRRFIGLKFDYDSFINNNAASVSIDYNDIIEILKKEFS